MKSELEASATDGPVMLPAHRLSVVVPVYNEQDSATELVDGIVAALADYGQPWELVVVDDGSSDETIARLRAAQERHGSHVRILALQRNYGQTAALQAGFDAARGDIAVTLDGDLQNDPRDIPGLVADLYDRDLDLLVGWRRRRQDATVLRKIPSQIANKIIRDITGVAVHDNGCAMKVFRASVFRQIRLYGEMHRFIAAWAATVTRPDRIGEREVRHHARMHGRSKYGLERTFKVVLDLIAVFFFMRFRAKPVHFFGTIGLLSGGLGAVILMYLAGVKFLLGEDIGSRPLLLVGVVLVIAAVQFVTTGIAMEMMSRTYFESERASSYLLREGDVSGQHATWSGPAAEHEVSV